MSSPRVSVIISNRNDVAMLSVTVRSCIEEFQPLGAGAGEIVICDNSDEPLFDYIKAAIPSKYIRDGVVQLIRQPFPCLFSARETAAKQARADYILCLDSHMIVPRDGILKLVEFMERNRDNETLGFAHAPLTWAHHHEDRSRQDRDMTRGELGPWGTAYNYERTITWKGMPWICRKDWFLDKVNGLGAYGTLSKHLLSWGGGDMHIGIKPWLLGFKNWAVPTRPFIHIGPFPKKDSTGNKNLTKVGNPLVDDGSKYRLYAKSGNYQNCFGFLVSCFILGGEPMIERNAPFIRKKFGLNTRDLTPQAIRLGTEERNWLLKRQVMSFEEMLEQKPWDVGFPESHSKKRKSKDIYKLWTSNTDDRRYFKPKRWAEVEKVIKDYNVKTVLEFGAGVSTLLFQSMDLEGFVSYETDPEYIKFIESIDPEKTCICEWDNKHLDLDGVHKFDFALVDGINPRTTQLELALKYARIVAIDDYIGANIKRLEIDMSKYERINREESYVAIFKVDK